MRKQLLNILLVTMLFLAGCAGINRQNLNKLEVGMAKAKVLEIMGEPYQTNAESNKEWLFYETGSAIQPNFLGYYVPSPARDWLTPILLQDGKLMAWGANLWKEQEQKRFEFSLR